VPHLVWGIFLGDVVRVEVDCRYRQKRWQSEFDRQSHAQELAPSMAAGCMK